MRDARAFLERTARKLLEVVMPRGPRSAKWLEIRLWNGFSSSAAEALEVLTESRSLPFYVKARARRALARWYFASGDDVRLATLPRSAQRVGTSTAQKRARKYQAVSNPRGTLHAYRTDAQGPAIHCDVVILSDFSLLGGTTSSNTQEIAAQTRAGLTTGLIHHPVWEWRVTKPLTPRISELIDGDSVHLLHSDQEVSCDLLIVRAPKMGEHLLDDLPTLRARRTVIIVNQTPWYHYGRNGGVGVAYDLPTCVENFAKAYGEATWYPIGPRVRSALEGHHAGELPEGSLADADWVNIIDVESWRREGRRAPDGKARIGRHSRDSDVKWPEDPSKLAAIYPVADPFEVHVLGGASVPENLLGGLPDNWVVHEFDSVPVPEFLHSLDVYVYFTASTYTEAFGRAPLEALAVGLPTILPHEFEELFGDAAIYTEVEGVQREVDKLMEDPEYYEAQATRALRYVSENFGYAAHLARIQQLGVAT